jgi:F0F1-type ATP synthase assembly protein I
MNEMELGQESKGKSPIGMIVFILLGLVFIYLVGQTTQLACTRVSESEVDCAIKSVWMGSLTVSSREASRVRNAYVDESYDYEDDSTTYRVVLKAKDGDVPVTRTYSSGNIQKRELAQDINDFIKDQSRIDAVFDFKGAGSIISAIVLGVFFALGIGTMISRARKRAAAPNMMQIND